MRGEIFEPIWDRAGEVPTSFARHQRTPTSTSKAVGFFYKQLHQPIEQVIGGGSPLVLKPRNSAGGHNVGVELEARSSLGRVWKRLDRFSLNTNASFIRSEVELPPSPSEHGSEKHPLQGQADYLVNAALSYLTPNGADLTLLLNATGKRLRTLAVQPLPDVYHQPFTSLDATLNFPFMRDYRIKVSARNLLDPYQQQLQGHREVSGYRTGRSYSIEFSYGS